MFLYIKFCEQKEKRPGSQAIPGAISEGGQETGLDMALIGKVAWWSETIPAPNPSVSLSLPQGSYEDTHTSHSVDCGSIKQLLLGALYEKVQSKPQFLHL